MRAQIISLLGQGHPATTVASALGITESRVSQVASEPEAAAEIANLRYSTLQKYNETDNHYQSLENKLLDKLEQSLVFIQRPMEIARTLQIINGAKRRGQESPQQIVHQNIVNITLPAQLLQRFTVDGANQVVQVGEQTLLTIPSNKVGALANDYAAISGSPACIRNPKQLTEADI